LKHTIHYEQMRPRDLERVLELCPVAYAPLGTLEFHGWHLPLGFDALKAQAICERAAVKTGGVVLPPYYTGFGGGHGEYAGSIIFDEQAFSAQLRRLCGRLAEMGFRVIVLLTGHYPQEQVAAVKTVAREVEAAHPTVSVLGLAEPEAYPGEFRGDHAAKWETSLGMHLLPGLVDLKGMERHEDPLCGVCGADPRTEASAQLGRETADGILEVLVAQVGEALRGNRPRPPWYYHNLGEQ
jgi:creatinine amidohydrolase